MLFYWKFYHKNVNRRIKLFETDLGKYFNSYDMNPLDLASARVGSRRILFVADASPLPKIHNLKSNLKPADTDEKV